MGIKDLEQFVDGIDSSHPVEDPAGLALLDNKIKTFDQPPPDPEPVAADPAGLAALNRFTDKLDQSPPKPEPIVADPAGIASLSRFVDQLGLDRPPAPDNRLPPLQFNPPEFPPLDAPDPQASIESVKRANAFLNQKPLSPETQEPLLSFEKPLNRKKFIAQVKAERKRKKSADTALKEYARINDISVDTAKGILSIPGAANTSDQLETLAEQELLRTEGNTSQLQINKKDTKQKQFESDLETSFVREFKKLSPAARVAERTAIDLVNLGGFREFLSRFGLQPGENFSALPGFFAARKRALDKLDKEAGLGEKIATSLTSGVPKAFLEFFLVNGLLKPVSLLGKGAVRLSATFAGQEALQAPREGETPTDRVKNVGKQAATGLVLSAAGKLLDKLPLGPIAKQLTRTTAITSGFGAETYVRTGGDIDATIESMVSVLGFEALGLTQKASEVIEAKVAIEKGLSPKTIMARLNSAGEILKVDKNRIDAALKNGRPVPLDLVEKYDIPTAKKNVETLGVKEINKFNQERVAQDNADSSKVQPNKPVVRAKQKGVSDGRPIPDKGSSVAKVVGAKVVETDKEAIKATDRSQKAKTPEKGIVTPVGEEIPPKVELVGPDQILASITDRANEANVKRATESVRKEKPGLTKKQEDKLVAEKVRDLEDSKIIEFEVDSLKEAQEAKKLGLKRLVDEGITNVSFKVFPKRGGGARIKIDVRDKSLPELKTIFREGAKLPPAERVVTDQRTLLKRLFKDRERTARNAFKDGEQSMTVLKKVLVDFVDRVLPKKGSGSGKRAAFLSKIAKARSFRQHEQIFDDVEKQIGLKATLGKLTEKSIKVNRVATENKQALQKIIEGAEKEFRTASGKLKSTIDSAEKKLKKSALKGGFNPKQSEQIRTILDSITTRNVTEKMRNRLEGFSDYLDRVRSDAIDLIGETSAELELPKNLIRDIALLEKIPINEMGMEQIESLTKEIKRLTKTSNLIARLKRVKITLDEAVEIAKKAFDNSRGKKKGPITREDSDQKGGFFVGTKQFLFGNSNHDVDTMQHTISGGKDGPISKILVDDVYSGRIKEASSLLIAYDIFENARVKAGFSYNELAELSSTFNRFLRGKATRFIRPLLSKITLGKVAKPAKFETFSVGDKEVKLSRADVMSLAMHSTSKYNIEQILQSDLAFRKKVIGQITEEQFRTIVKTVTPKEQILLDAAKEILDGVLKEKANEVSQKLDGEDKFDVTGYWHIDRLFDKTPLGRSQFWIPLVESRGNLKQRTGGKQPIIIHDFFSQLVQSINATSEYIGMAEPLRGATTLMNYKPFIDAVDSRGYKTERLNVNKLLERMQAGRPFDDSLIGHVVGKIVRQAVRSVLAEPGIAIGQYTSVEMFFTEFPNKYRKELRGVYGKKQLDEIRDHIPVLAMRIDGKMSSIALGDVTNNDPVLKNLTPKGAARDSLLFGLHGMDTAAIVDGVRMAKSFIADTRPELEIGSQKYWDAVGAKIGKAVARTQPNFNIENRSILTSDPVQLNKSFFLFRSFVDQPMRVISRANTDFRNGNITRIQQANQIGTVLHSLALNTLVRSGAAAVLYGDRKNIGQLLTDAVTAPVRLVPVLGTFIQGVLKTVSSKFRRRVLHQRDEKKPFVLLNVENIAQEVIGRGEATLNLYVDALMDSFLGKNRRARKKFKRALEKSTDVVGLAIGLPLTTGVKLEKRVEEMADKL